MTARRLRVVIVGGGFAGLYAATYLGRSELADAGAHITLLDRKNYFTFTPLLAEVAAGTLGREHVTYPYRSLARRHNFTFALGTAESVDFDAGVVTTHQATFPYDYLVLAVGAAPRYFGNDALRRHSMPLTSVDDALAIRDRVIGALERAALAPERERESLLTFVVAGAGPAGVEVASEIHHLANDVLRPFYPPLPPAGVVLADGGDRILTGWDADLAHLGLRRLQDRGLDVRLRTRVVAATPTDVTLREENGVTECIPTRTLVWTAGTAPVSWADALGLPTERGALTTRPSLQVPGRDNVFAVGDVTHVVDARAGRPYPRVAPIAISQGIRAAANIENHALGRELEPYEAHHAGKIISLGCGVALVDLLGVKVTGPPAWWIYRAAYLLKLVGMKNKIRVIVTLILNRVFEPDITSQAQT